MTDQDLLNLLDTRVERLHKEFDVKAPSLIIKTELTLIIDCCNKLLKNLK